MSLVNFSHVCSHLQNASLARLGLTSIPLSNLHLRASLVLQKQGFLSTVTLGGQTPPPRLLPSADESDLPRDVQKAIARGETTFDKAMAQEEEVTQANRASRRLWLGLKYWDSEPVLRKMQMVSKPTRRIWVSSGDLDKIVRGKTSGFVKGMTRIGECMLVSTDKGVMEAREAAERKIGGMVLCRVY